MLREWQDWPSNKRIFNIYGITEVSCWATILEVQTKDLELEDIPIGRVFDDETLLDFKAIPEGGEELLIGSETRICSIEDELPVLCPVFRSTGDQVVRLNDQIFCVGRTNSLIKKFGIRINLSKIDNIAKKLVLNTCCIFENNKIILFYISNEINQQELLKHLRNELKDFEIPDEIFKLNEFLLSAHGKVCKQKLSVTYKEMRAKIQINPEHIFLEELNYLSNLSDNPAKKPKLDLSFKAIGGSSIEALRITMSLESKLNRPLPDLLTILLNQNRSLEDAHNYLKGFTIFQVLESSKPDSQGKMVKLRDIFN